MGALCTALVFQNRGQSGSAPEYDRRVHGVIAIAMAAYGTTFSRSQLTGRLADKRDKQLQALSCPSPCIPCPLPLPLFHAEEHAVEEVVSRQGRDAHVEENALEDGSGNELPRQQQPTQDCFCGSRISGFVRSSGLMVEETRRTLATFEIEIHLFQSLT